jgi:hypothetical protein
MDHARLRQRLLTVVALMLLMTSAALTTYVVELRTEVQQLQRDVDRNRGIGITNQHLLCDIRDHVLGSATATCRPVPQ